MIWAEEAALAVDFMHSSGILHRDIKSPNFVLVKGILKIADFGMSWATVEYSLSRKRETGEQVVGSARWLAPETTSEAPEFSEKSGIPDYPGENL